MGVDQAGRDVTAVGVDFQRAARGAKILTDASDLAVADQQITAFQNAGLIGRPQRSVADQHMFWLLRNRAHPGFDVVRTGRCGNQPEQRTEQNSIEHVHTASSTSSGPLLRRARTSKLLCGLEPLPLPRSPSIPRKKVSEPDMPRREPSMRTFRRLPDTRASASGMLVPMISKLPERLVALPLSSSAASILPMPSVASVISQLPAGSISGGSSASSTLRRPSTHTSCSAGDSTSNSPSTRIKLAM